MQAINLGCIFFIQYISTIDNMANKKIIYYNKQLSIMFNVFYGLYLLELI